MSDQKPEVVFGNGIIGAIERGEDIDRYRHEFWTGVVDDQVVMRMDKYGLLVLADALHYAALYVKEKQLPGEESFDTYLRAIVDYYELKG